MNHLISSLLEFNKAFDIPKLDTPDIGEDDLIELRIKLLQEEVAEYAKVEIPPKGEGKQIMMILVPQTSK